MAEDSRPEGLPKPFGSLDLSLDRFSLQFEGDHLRYAVLSHGHAIDGVGRFNGATVVNHYEDFTEAQGRVLSDLYIAELGVAAPRVR